jgi:hypothetical protein
MELQTTNALPTLQELFSDNIEVVGKAESLNAILNTPPPDKWVKEHPYIKDHKYLPIDKVEYLLRKLFKRYQIAITGQGTSFNGVWVTVRVKYMDPVNGEWNYCDGIGACELQVQKGKSPADLANINRGAISMAFPIAKTLAIKDACELIGNIFGANLNRKDTIPFSPDMGLINDYKSLQGKADERMAILLKEATDKKTLDELRPYITTDAHLELYNQKVKELA